MKKLQNSQTATDSNFQLEIVKGINEQNISKNIMVSPLSIYHILSLTANGAATITLEEMLKTLCHKNKIELNKENSLISSTISKLKSIQMANAIFTKFKPEQVFIKAVEMYKSTIDDLKSKEQVNSWCSKATNGKIPTIIDDINGIMMILINAIYFKGVWKKTFDKNLTTKNEFLNLAEGRNYEIFKSKYFKMVKQKILEIRKEYGSELFIFYELSNKNIIATRGFIISNKGKNDCYLSELIKVEDYSFYLLLAKVNN